MYINLETNLTTSSIWPPAVAGVPVTGGGIHVLVPVAWDSMKLQHLV